MAVLVIPYHDPRNIETPLLQKLLPILKNNFKRAFVSVTPKTADLNPKAITWFKSDSFFLPNFNNASSQIGDHYLGAYRSAIQNTNPSDYLHICNTDRLVYALTFYRTELLDDMHSAEQKEAPTMFIRSKKAWETHPRNYCAIEAMLTRAGEVLFKKSIDYAWCQMSISSLQLKAVIRNVKAHDLVVNADLALTLRDRIYMKEVDWLSWEDPFVLQKDPVQYKSEREIDPLEFEKRINYAVPILNFLQDRYRDEIRRI